MVLVNKKGTSFRWSGHVRSISKETKTVTVTNSTFFATFFVGV